MNEEQLAALSANLQTALQQNDYIARQNQAIAQRLQEIEQRSTSRQAQPVPAQGDIAIANQKVLTELADNPIRVLGDVAALAKQQAKEEMAAELRQLRVEQDQKLTERDLQQRYLNDPKIKFQPHAFDWYLQRTDANLPIGARYEQAAELTRKYVDEYHQGVIREHEQRSQLPTAGALPFVMGGVNFAAPQGSGPTDQRKLWEEQDRDFRAMQDKKRSLRAVA